MYQKKKEVGEPASFFLFPSSFPLDEERREDQRDGAQQLHQHVQ